MAKADALRLTYGPCKYAAIHLMLSRWLRLRSSPRSEYTYVTLGGTELRDVQSLYFVDPRLTTRIFSFETDSVRYRLAEETAKALQARGINVTLMRGSFFSYQRVNNSP